jgi:methylmalonyl-CoA/ethylmalonyl-CoA epimerase
MAVNRIDHVGIAVADLDEAQAQYVQLFGAVAIGRDSMPDTDAVLLELGDTRIELVAPRGAETPVGKFLANRGPGMHHVAYEVADVAAELARLTAEGVELVDEVPRPGLFGHTVAFVHPRSVGGVLAELVAHGRE